MNRKHDTEHRSRLAIIPAPARDQALIKVNRFLLHLVLALTVAVFALGFWALPSGDWITSLKPADYTHAYRAQMNPVVASELDALKTQMVGLVSGSIESKLKVLEQSIRLGHQDYTLSTLEGLRSDVQILKSYSESAQQARQAVINEQVLAEMSHLKRLIYWTLASCGLMLAAAAGVWFHQHRRLPAQLSKRLLGKH
ncbi:MAG: hypothetical protein RQ715_03725 [Methylococcales bacterium]|nr:hypothetical protein [Methylococcales bacterium]